MYNHYRSTYAHERNLERDEHEFLSGVHGATCYATTGSNCGIREIYGALCVDSGGIKQAQGTERVHYARKWKC